MSAITVGCFESSLSRYSHKSPGAPSSPRLPCCLFCYWACFSCCLASFYHFNTLVWPETGRGLLLLLLML